MYNKNDKNIYFVVFTIILTKINKKFFQLYKIMNVPRIRKLKIILLLLTIKKKGHVIY